MKLAQILSTSTNPILPRLLQFWGVRLAMPFVAVAGAITVFDLLDLDQYTSLVLLLAILSVQILAVDSLRAGGSIAASGLALTRSSGRFVASGAVVACGALVLIGLTALALDGSFHVVDGAISGSVIMTYSIQSAVEELCFRGTIFDVLHERFGPRWAVGVTAMLFGLAHALNPGASTLAVTNVVLAGALLGLMVLQTTSLWASISFHIAWNLSVATFFGSVSGGGGSGMVTSLDTRTISNELRWLVDGPFGIEQGAVTTIVLVASCIVVLVWFSPDRSILAARLRRHRAEHTHPSPLPSP
jgi:membrane protease YdiL (CAAX protease family)